VYAPTQHCLNLAAAVNVVLCDRRLKRHLAGKGPPESLRAVLSGRSRPFPEATSRWEGLAAG
jgi:hypothetical protein